MQARKLCFSVASLAAVLFVVVVCGVCGPVMAQSVVGPRLVVQSGPQARVVVTLALSVDGRLLASSTDIDPGTYIWESATGRLLCTLPTREPGKFAFLTDGDLLATSSKGDALLVWDIRSCSLSRRVVLSPSSSEATTSVTTLSKDRVLLQFDEQLFVVNPSTSSGQLVALDNNPAAERFGRIRAVLGHSVDGQNILVAAVLRADNVPLPRTVLQVRNVERNSVDPLSDYVGAPADSNAIAGSIPAAVLSPSQRYVVAVQSGQLTVYDLKNRRVTANASLDMPAGKASQVPTAPTRSAQIDPKLQAQMDSMLRMLPPDQAAKMKAQMDAALGGAMQQAQQVMADPQGTAAALLGSASTWMGFSDDEKYVLLWRSKAVNETIDAAQRARGARLEVRRINNLQIERTVEMDSNLSVNQMDSLLATNFAASADGKWLALAATNLVGAKMAVVDLTSAAFPLRAWTPNHGATSGLAWASDAQLVTLHSQQMRGVANASTSRMTGFPQAMPGANPGSDPTKAVSAHLVRWNLTTGDTSERVVESGILLGPVALASQGGFAAAVGIGQDQNARFPIEQIDIKTGTTVRKVALVDVANPNASATTAPSGIAISPDGKLIAALWSPRSSEQKLSREERRNRPRARLLIHDAVTGRSLSEHDVRFAVERESGEGNVLRFSGDGRALVLVGQRREALVVNVENKPFQAEAISTGTDILGIVEGNPLRIVVAEGREREPTQADGLNIIRLKDASKDAVVAGSVSGHWLASASGATIALYSVPKSGQLEFARRFAGHQSSVTALSFSPDGRWLASAAQSGEIFLWDVQTGQWLARLYAFADGTWAVVDSQGRFDTNRVENIEQLHWILPSDPLHAVPLDVFMRDYFEPRLLSRLLAGETLPAVRDLSAINVAQPVINITQIVRSPGDANSVDVTVSVRQTKDHSGIAGGVADARLFRGGSLVASAANTVTLDAQGQALLHFTGIKLPARGGDIAFSAYAFNRDRVKSATTNAIYSAPVRQEKGRAYVISIGVNTHENPAWNLSFAANDARRAQQVLTKSLTSLSAYADVVAIPLIADGDWRSASKASLAAVFSALAGKPGAALGGIHNAQQLRAATPDDLVIVTFSGHGFTDNAGVFYLLPSDTGGGYGRALDATMSARSISTTDLAAWLRDVDAGEIALVVDACQSAASVEQEGFKPGPMGSKGLGQLAYDKGIRILAASQADNFALEARELRHGLLTHALLNDGLVARHADFAPRDKEIELGEWLRFAAQRVPQLYADMQTGKLAATRDDGRGITRVDTIPAISNSAIPSAMPVSQLRRVQEPKLFDFHRTARDPVIAR